MFQTLHTSQCYGAIVWNNGTYYMTHLPLSSIFVTSCDVLMVAHLVT